MLLRVTCRGSHKPQTYDVVLGTGVVDHVVQVVIALKRGGSVLRTVTPGTPIWWRAVRAARRARQGVLL